MVVTFIIYHLKLIENDPKTRCLFNVLDVNALLLLTSTGLAQPCTADLAAHLAAGDISAPPTNHFGIRLFGGLTKTG